MRRFARSAGVLLVLLFGFGLSMDAQTESLSYKAKCEVCHGSAGLADTPQAKRLNVLPFTDPTVVAKSDTTLIGIIENGSGKMPAFKGKATDQEVNSFIQFIRQVQQK